MLCECCWLRKGNEQAWDRGERLPLPWLPCFPVHPPIPSHILGCQPHDSTCSVQTVSKGLWFG